MAFERVPTQLRDPNDHRRRTVGTWRRGRSRWALARVSTSATTAAATKAVRAEARPRWPVTNSTVTAAALTSTARLRKRLYATPAPPTARRCSLVAWATIVTNACTSSKRRAVTVIGSRSAK